MKSTIVPAQITTVEDRVAGSLTVSQLLLLMAPILISCVVYILFPHPMRVNDYKIVLSIIITVVFAAVAIRYKGKIILLWLVLILRYNLRPKYYVFDKNSTAVRQTDPVQHEEPEKQSEIGVKTKEQLALNLTAIDAAKIEQLIKMPNADLTIMTGRKGGMRVSFKEIG